jgi:hypothetical protein
VAVALLPTANAGFLIVVSKKNLSVEESTFFAFDCTHFVQYFNYFNSVARYFTFTPLPACQKESVNSSAVFM